MDLQLPGPLPIMLGSAYLTEAFHGGFPFWIYVIFSIGSIIFGWLVIPETKGKTLEEMEQLWTPKKDKDWRLRDSL